MHQKLQDAGILTTVCCVTVLSVSAGYLMHSSPAQLEVTSRCFSVAQPVFRSPQSEKI